MDLKGRALLGMSPPSVFVAFDGNRLDQYCFLRHDFVLAAVVAIKLIKGGGKVGSTINGGV